MVKYCVKRIKINGTKSLPAEKTAYSSAHLSIYGFSFCDFSYKRSTWSENIKQKIPEINN